MRFYVDGLGLAVVASFRNHAGYDGVVLSLPDRSDHLEFTSSAGGSPCPSPTNENLLVFYVPDREVIRRTQERLASFGCRPVVAENPYWTANRAITYEDPDGWRVVLFHGLGLQRPAGAADDRSGTGEADERSDVASVGDA